MLMKPFSKYILLILLATVLAVTTFVFGALPMRVLRRGYGRTPFWMGLMIASLLVGVFVSLSYGLLILALTVAVGVFAEIEDHGGEVFTSGFAATMAAIGLSVLAVGMWIHQTKGHLLEDVRSELVPLVDKIATMNSSAVVSVDSVIQQLPSGLVIGVIIAIAISLIAEARMMAWFGLVVQKRPAGAPESLRLSSFRVPDVFIWLSIVAIFGAFFRHGNELAEAVSINTLNVLVVSYFFQGLAVASRAFRVYKISAFWRSLWYVVLVLQLFLLVSLVGFVDFWLDFRERLARKPAEPNKGF